MKRIKVSVIIPVYNEEKEITDCLKSLAKQTIKDVEIIVVDDGSSDSSVRTVANLKSQISNLKIFAQDHAGPAMARNLGAKHARGETLVFVDADMTFDKNFLKELVKPIVKSKTKGTFSKYEYVSNWDNVWARCWNYNQNLRGRIRLPDNYPDKQKVFRAILKSEFERAGGFEKGGYTDDYTLSDKLGYKASAVNGAKFYHKNPDRLSEVYSQSKWSAKRKYKFGILGVLYSLFRSSIPISAIIGLAKSATYREPKFIIFKVIYDGGAFNGILEAYIANKWTK